MVAPGAYMVSFSFTLYTKKEQMPVAVHQFLYKVDPYNKILALSHSHLVMVPGSSDVYHTWL